MYVQIEVSIVIAEHALERFSTGQVSQRMALMIASILPHDTTLIHALLDMAVNRRLNVAPASQHDKRSDIRYVFNRGGFCIRKD